MPQFENAEGVGQFQPSGWSAATTLGSDKKETKNPERVCLNGEPFQGYIPLTSRCEPRTMGRS